MTVMIEHNDIVDALKEVHDSKLVNETSRSIIREVLGVLDEQYLHQKSLSGVILSLLVRTEYSDEKREL